MKRVSQALFVVLVLIFAGCGQSSPDAESSHAMRPEQDAGNEFSETVDAAIVDVASESNVTAVRSAEETAVEVINRKIIYQCELDLVVDDYKKFESRLPALVSNYGGFVANHNTDRRYRNNQSGTWIVRIPVSQYSIFLNGVHSLGFAESRTETAQDVTEEFVDVEARIKTKRQLETRILKMLDERDGKLADVLQIERELSRVREEVERMEGRVRYLKDRTSLATVTIRCREEQSYAPAAAPTLASRISQSWQASLTSIRQLGETALIVLIATLPWLIVLITMAGLGYLIKKRFWHAPRAT